MSFLAVPGIISGRSSVAWDPLALSPEGYWRADLGHAEADTDPVPLWANQGSAGSAGDLEASPALVPLYYESWPGVNGQPVLDFTGGEVLYTAAGSWWHLASESSSMTVIAVARTTLSIGVQDVVMTRAWTSVGGFRLQIRPGAACTFGAEEIGGGASANDNGASATQNAVHVLAGVLTGAASTSHDSAECWLDGVSGGATTADLPGLVGASPAREFLVGGTATTTGTFTGQLAEIVFVKRLLTSGEDASLTAYLNARYGLALSGVTQ